MVPAAPSKAAMSAGPGVTPPSPRPPPAGTRVTPARRDPGAAAARLPPPVTRSRIAMGHHRPADDSNPDPRARRADAATCEGSPFADDDSTSERHGHERRNGETTSQVRILCAQRRRAHWQLQRGDVKLSPRSVPSHRVCQRRLGPELRRFVGEASWLHVPTAKIAGRPVPPSGRARTRTALFSATTLPTVNQPGFAHPCG